MDLSKISEKKLEADVKSQIKEHRGILSNSYGIDVVKIAKLNGCKNVHEVAFSIQKIQNDEEYVEYRYATTYQASTIDEGRIVWFEFVSSVLYSKATNRVVKYVFDGFKNYGNYYGKLRTEHLGHWIPNLRKDIDIVSAPLLQIHDLLVKELGEGFMSLETFAWEIVPFGDSERFYIYGNRGSNPDILHSNTESKGLVYELGNVIQTTLIPELQKSERFNPNKVFNI